MIASPKKVAFYTLGCKLNFSETSTIARNFQQEGFERVDFEEVADIYVINTCSVTENADKQFKQIVKRETLFCQASDGSLINQNPLAL